MYKKKYLFALVKNSILFLAFFFLSSCSFINDRIKNLHNDVNQNAQDTESSDETIKGPGTVKGPGTGMFDYQDPTIVTIYYDDDKSIEINDEEKIDELTLQLKEKGAFRSLEKGEKVTEECDIFIDYHNQRGYVSILSTEPYGHLGKNTKKADMKLSNELHEYILSLISENDM